mmetsp:Transcript_22680/g.31997  ORF Transcript_22680/g.31997 Transcript_22680/m.31997 type:complete len:392 (+) Transcript_22680:211-1386(+)
MKPQHLLVAVPLTTLSALSTLGVQGFVPSVKKTSTPLTTSTLSSDVQTFVRQNSSTSNMPSQSAVTDTIETSFASPLDLNININNIDLEDVLKRKPPVPMEIATNAHGMPWEKSIGSSEHSNPLLYMPFWEWQMDFMSSTLTNLRPCSEMDCFEENSKFGLTTNADKKARIVNHCYSSDEYRKIRMTYYDAGDNTQVFNSVWYPNEEYDHPILGIDLLSFNRKKYLAIVDFQPIHESTISSGEDQEKIYNRLQLIKDHYPSLKGRMSSKFYDETQFFSQQMLFSRFEDEDIVQKELFPAFTRYVRLHTKIIQKELEPNASPKSKARVLARQAAYDTYSAERDPATGLFCSMFGKDWGEAFVFDFLFSLSSKKDQGLVIPPMPGAPPPNQRR